MCRRDFRAICWIAEPIPRDGAATTRDGAESGHMGDTSPVAGLRPETVATCVWPQIATMSPDPAGTGAASLTPWRQPAHPQAYGAGWRP